MKDSTETASVSIERRAKKHVRGRSHTWFAVCAPGTEAVLRAELAGLGIEPSPADIPGGVEFVGRLETGMQANLCLRTATRVLVRIRSFRARAVEDVFRETVAVAWEAWLPTSCTLEIQPTIHESRIESRTLLVSTIVDAVRRRFVQEGLAVPDFADKGASQTLMARLTADHLELSLDSSGELLHRRGWRRESVAAPIRESLAAAILLAAGFRPDMNLVDGMCGSGTLAIEAALISAGIQPGLSATPPRTFAFMEWPAFSRPAWDHICRNSGLSSVQGSSHPDYVPTPAVDRSQPKPAYGLIFARDIDPAAVAATAANAANAGVGSIVGVELADFFESAPPCEPGLLVLNPPYGMRLDINGTPAGMYHRIARVLSAGWSGWRYAVIVPDAAQARHWPLRTDITLPFMHGGLKAAALIGHI
jgi:putative N6-adenine-specific DNA methylase